MIDLVGPWIGVRVLIDCRLKYVVVGWLVDWLARAPCSVLMFEHHISLAISTLCMDIARCR